LGAEKGRVTTQENRKGAKKQEKGTGLINRRTYTQGRRGSNRATKLDALRFRVKRCASWRNGLE